LELAARGCRGASPSRARQSDDPRGRCCAGAGGKACDLFGSAAGICEDELDATADKLADILINGIQTRG
jgi:hypothetical protein